MWHLQQRSLDKARIFFIKIIFLSVALHLIVLFIIFFVHNKQSLNLRMRIDKNSKSLLERKIIFLPFQKVVKGALNNLNKENQKIKNLKPKTVQGSSKSQKAIQKGKVCIQQKSEKILLKKSKIQEVKKANSDKPIEQSISEKKVDEQIKKEEVKTETKVVENEPLSQTATPAILPDVICMGRQDMQMLELYEAVKSEISRNWNPPIGFAKNLKCVIRISIDLQGKIVQAKIEKSSNAIAFDLSARKAVLQSVVPKQVWGKDLLLDFAQEG